MRRSLLVWLLSLAALSAVAAPAKLGDPKALKGGELTIGYPGYPKALLYYLAFDELAQGINQLILETLIEIDPRTYEFRPLLASSWKVSADQKTFTFKIDGRAKFSDGKPVTAHDVKFTWDTLFDKKNKTAPFQAYFSSFESCTPVDDSTIEFKAKTVHFKNLEKIASLFILPKHFFSHGDLNKSFGTKLLGSGAYTLEEARQGDRVILKRNPEYWGATLTQNIGRYNFDKLIFRAIEDYNVQYEMFKKGDIDYYPFFIAKMWATETDGPTFKNKWTLKLKAENKLPYGTQGIAWNLRRPLFTDKRVRFALSHLFNRERMIKDLFYNNYVASSGIVNLTSEYHSPKNKPLAYDPKKAKALLKEAGWSEVGSDGVLNKNGARFEFELLCDNPQMVRFLTVYQEDLKAMGIKMNIRTQDWASTHKLLDDRQFDASLINRGREIDPSDFGVMWASDQADIKGSGNITGYKNPEADKLIKLIDETMDKKKRVPLVRKLDELIADEQPMTFAWEPTFFRVAYWNKFSFPGKGYFEYSYWRDTFQYWWLDPKKEAKLKKARSEGKPL